VVEAVVRPARLGQRLESVARRDWEISRLERQQGLEAALCWRYQQGPPPPLPPLLMLPAVAAAPAGLP